MPSGCSGGKPHSCPLLEEHVGGRAARGAERERRALAPRVEAVGVDAERLVEVEPGAGAAGELAQLLVDEPLRVGVVAERGVVAGDREAAVALGLGPDRPAAAVPLAGRAEARVVGQLGRPAQVLLERVAAARGPRERARELLEHGPAQRERRAVVDDGARRELAPLVAERGRGEQLARRGRALELGALREVGVQLVPEQAARGRVRARLAGERGEERRAADEVAAERVDGVEQRPRSPASAIPRVACERAA